MSSTKSSEGLSSTSLQIGNTLNDDSNDMEEDIALEELSDMELLDEVQKTVDEGNDGNERLNLFEKLNFDLPDTELSFALPKKKCDLQNTKDGSTSIMALVNNGDNVCPVSFSRVAISPKLNQRKIDSYYQVTDPQMLQRTGILKKECHALVDAQIGASLTNIGITTQSHCITNTRQHGVWYVDTQTSTTFQTGRLVNRISGTLTLPNRDISFELVLHNLNPVEISVNGANLNLDQVDISWLYIFLEIPIPMG